MSCFICQKKNGTVLCSREDCEIRVCNLCVKFIGGSKWVSCEQKFQYYCHKHLVRKCVVCECQNDGCCKCLVKKKMGGFRKITTCCVCDTIFCHCKDCSPPKIETKYDEIFLETKDEFNLENESKIKIFECYMCGGFCCKDCTEMAEEKWDLDRRATHCHDCVTGFSPDGCDCWKCRK